VHELGAYLEIVNAFHIREVRTQTGIGQASALAECRGLIGKRVGAGEIPHPVLPNPCARIEQSCLTEQVCESGRDVERPHELPLILPGRKLIVIVRLLEPGTRGREI
jgi:hypothetical protein